MTARLLVDNLFSPRIYPLHVLSSNENSDLTASVAAARRSVHDAWSPNTTNADAWNKSRNDQQRAADMIVLDRTNMTGEIVKAQFSDDDFVSSPQDGFNGTLPTFTAAGALTDQFGVLTTEGSWLKRFDLRWANDVRAYYVAMGAGLKPIVPGLWIGLSWSPGEIHLPFDRRTELLVEETHSDRGWLGSGQPVNRRGGVLRFRFASLIAAENAVWHIDQMAARRPFWVIPDEAQAQDAFLAVIPKGSFGLEHANPHWMYPELAIPYTELNPRGAGD